ncbi:MAG: hypothetical protein ACOC7V_11860 [Spirochaetota bacterium]
MQFLVEENIGLIGQGVDLVGSLDPDGVAVEADSTVERELAMLASHTVHHYAIIALILRIQDVPVPEEFGVAPLRCATSRRGSPECAP